MPIIMLSYRRDDTKWVAGRIFDRLEDHYGKGNVFMDIDAIPVGLDFREHLQQNLQRCDILLAIVGPDWLGTDEQGHHAIAEETDWVRIEIETALAKKIPVIPVLVDRVRMPKATDMPESLRNFAFRQAAEIASGVDFRTHMDRLIRSMDQHLRGQVTPLSATSDAASTVSPSAPATAIGSVSAEKWDTAATRLLGSDKIKTPDVPPANVARTETNSESVRAVLPHAIPPRSNRSLPDIAGVVQRATRSWWGAASLLLLSEVIVILSEQVVKNDGGVLILSVVALIVGSIGLISIGFRLYGYLNSLNGNTGALYGTALLGVLAVAAVPSFFHLTQRPTQYVVTAAWPLILLGELGLILVAVALISQTKKKASQLKSIATWMAVGIGLLLLAWLDSNPTSSIFPPLHWRMRSVFIFTEVFVSAVIFAVVAACVLVMLGRGGLAKGIHRAKSL